MEDSFNSPKNKRQRSVKPQSDGDQRTPKRTPKRRLSDSADISKPNSPSSTEMQQKEIFDDLPSLDHIPAHRLYTPAQLGIQEEKETPMLMQTYNLTSLEEEKDHPPKKQSLPEYIDTVEKNIQAVNNTTMDVMQKTR
ncbi:hypothetical protein AMTR_s00040p00095760 [Amborella trichopoda]|uniref:Uncharacterized protein n=1 Tax=Amborella trichopoda TaxID=13333 RepID=W1PZJ6_AMBTC|nr:hypothetical protein AMTR_s00040p00095760 [Amborella trichopoda]